MERVFRGSSLFLSTPSAQVFSVSAFLSPEEPNLSSIHVVSLGNSVLPQAR